jgi:hypothetical protein
MPRNLKILILGFVGFIFINSCIDKYDVPSAIPPLILNVEGFITTLPKSHSVRLSWASRFGTEFIGRNLPVERATVLIKDDLGGVVSLMESGSGIYESPPDFAAEVGKSYSLDITLLNGKRYVSLNEKVSQVPEVDSVTYMSVRRATTDRLNDEIGVQVIAHFKDPEEKGNYYFWNSLESDFALITEPEQYHLPPDHPTCPRCPAPKECCSRCYHKDIPKPANIMIFSDFDGNGLYQRKEIAYIFDNGLRFKDTYRLDVQHLSISAEAYRFLRLVDQQMRLSGSVFDLPPANIRGNIISLDNMEEQVLGHFFASDERFLRIYIKREKLEFYLRPQTTVPDDCREFLQQTFFTMPYLPVDPPSDWNPN